MKKALIYIFGIVFICFAISACEDDDSQETFVSTSDLALETFSTVVANDTIGTVFGTSNMGSVTFNIISQTPSGAFSIDDLGNLIVVDAAAFSTAGDSDITAEVGVNNGDVQKTATIVVTVLTCPEITPFTGNTIFTSSFSDTANVVGTAKTGNTCAVVYTGIDPLFTFLDCDTETSLIIVLSPSQEDPTVGALTINKQAYGCSDADNGFKVEGTGEYDVTSGLFTFDYTLLLNGDEWDSGSVTVSNEDDADTDGDGISNGDEIANGTDEQDPCDPEQNEGYDGFDVDNFTWADADCDGDSITNGDEVADGTDPYKAEVFVGDTDGDGIDDADEVANGSDRNNPCDPTQPMDYDGFDETNAIWAAADCDGDSILNGDEVTNGTDPYTADGSSCTNTADTSIWQGNLTVMDAGDPSSTDTATGLASCGTLELTGDWPVSFYCDAGLLPVNNVVFTPSGANDGTGTVSVERQAFEPCVDGIPYEIEGTGTYDENTGLISIDWALYDVEFDPDNPDFESTTEIVPE